jgi:CRP-like cAMP-binding protein
MKEIGYDEAFIPKVKSIMIFRVLSDEEIATLISVGCLVEYDAGEPIVHEHIKENALFGIVSGTVSVTVRQNDKDVFVCSLGAGDVFGEAAVFMNVERTATVVSSDEVILFRLTREQLLSFVKLHSVAGNRMFLVIIYSLLRKLRSANQELAFERRDDSDQDDIDALVESFMP